MAVTTAWRVVTEDGLRHLSKRTLQRVGLNGVALRLSPQLALRINDAGRSVARLLHRARRRRAPAAHTDADPFKRVQIDPACVEYRYDPPSPAPVDRKCRLGLVRGGSWDHHRIRIRERTFFRSLETRYVEDRPWDETPWYQAVLEAIEAGDRKWRCETVADLEQRCAYTDRLYESMATQGYVPQRQLVEQGQGSFPLRDPIVSVGRDGELIHFRDGNHRLSLAKLIGVDAITVIVGLRHEEWQRRRDRIADTHATDGSATDALDHPDLADLSETTTALKSVQAI